MEAATVSIAQSALNSAVKASTIAIKNEIGLLLRVQQDLLFIKEELEMMQAFLRAASTENAKGETVTVWVKQVQELAYDVEDCLQDASLKLKKKCWLTSVFSLKARHQIAIKIQVLKVRIEDVSQRNIRYSLIKSSNDQTSSLKYKEKTLARLTTNEEALVGLDTREQDLVKLILGNHEMFKVISVVGMGGLGKTTVVRKVFDSQELSDNFECFAWVTVLHPFNMEEFTRSLFKQLSSVDAEEAEPIRPPDGNKLKMLTRTTTKPKTREEKMEEMETKINEHLKSKKYVVVLDDLSREADWDAIRPLLPNESKSCRIIVTTRSESLTKYISKSNDDIYMMNPLSNDESLELFYKTVFQTASNPFEPDDCKSKDGGSLVRSKSDPSVREEQDVLTTKPEITEAMKEQASLIIDRCGKDGGSLERSKSGPSVREEQDVLTTKPEITEAMKEQASLIIDRCGKDGGSLKRSKNGPSVREEQDVLTTKPEITEAMKEQASLIIDRCGGLPLPIVTIGRCLASRDITSAVWLEMNDHLTSEINLNPHLDKIRAVLTSSYDGLPHHLKFPFLYLGVFYNHQEIRRSRVIRRWLAEGYLTGRRDMTAEEVGEKYFYDLMSRSLIQPSKSATILNGTVTRCSIHDLIYELIVGMSQDENVVSLLEDHNNRSMMGNVRHLVIAGEQSTQNYIYILENVSWSHMRSLTIFGMVEYYHPYARFLSYARFLRVLDLEGTLNLENIHLSRIGDLRFLRYLGLRGTTITKLPASLGKLHDLETLDIRNTVIAQLPKGIVNLHKLSYLRAGFDYYKSKSTYDRYLLDCSWFEIFLILSIIPCLPCSFVSKSLEDSYPTAANCLYKCIYLFLYPLFYFEEKRTTDGPNKGNFGSFAVKAPRGIGKLGSLCNLGMIDISGLKNIAKAMKNLTNLKKLGVTGLSERNGKRFAKVIKELTQLRTLVLSSAENSDLSHCLKSLENFPPSLKYLRSLKLYSPVYKLPDWINKLENLVKMHLRNTKLEMDNVNEIGKLPNLTILCVSKNSFSGDELRFGKPLHQEEVVEIMKDPFPMLQALVIERMKDLTLISFEESSMPRLKKLEINRCRSLCQGGLLGLEHLVQLKEILVKYKHYEDDEKQVYNENIQALENELNNKISSQANQPGLRVMKY